MTTPRDADRILRAWLDLMPDEAPDRTVAAVLQAVEMTPQTRRPLVRAPWRSTPMTRFALIAAATALGVALLGGALLVGGNRNPTPTPAPVVPATSTPATPTPTPEARAAAPEALRGNWLSDAAGHTIFGDITGYVRLVVPTNGGSAWMLAPVGNEAGRSTVNAIEPDILELTLDRDRPDCAAGAIGRYRWSVADDRLRLTLEPIEDACPARAEALGRTWTRTHVGASYGGTAVVPDVGPLFQLTLPEGSYATRSGPDSQEIYDQPRDYTLFAWRNPQAFVDPCTKQDRHEWRPGATAFLDALKQNPALENFTTEDVTIGGYPALHVRFNASAEFPKCQPDHPFYEWVPRDDPDGGWWLSGGDVDSLFVVDHPDATMMFQVLPVADASEADVMASIRFLDGLPTAP